jgi:protein-serine/threonine kinase
MFECLVGYPPFCSESTHETYQKIINWPHYLAFPDDVHLSREAEDLIRRCVPQRHFSAPCFFSCFLLKYGRLICSPDRRLAVEQIKKHSFFYGVDWEQIREIDAPFVPRLRSITDTSYFPTDELQEVPDEPAGADTSGANKDLAFLGLVALLLTRKWDLIICYNQIHLQEVHR